MLKSGIKTLNEKQLLYVENSLLLEGMSDFNNIMKSSFDLFTLIHEYALTYLLVYKVSQDHLQLFFSSVRYRGGWNNKLTGRQFKGAYRRLLVRSETREGRFVN